MVELCRQRIRLGLLAGTAFLFPATAHAMTLAEMIAMVRQGNPEIAAQKAQVAADRMQIAIAQSPGRPRVQVNGSFAQGTNGANVSSGFDRTLDDSLLASLPLFDGGQVHDDVAVQRLKLSASRAHATNTETQVVSDAITAYLDVLRDRKILALTEQDLELLDNEMGANRARFKEGDVTRTDLSQTEARRALAAGRLADAQTRLATSEETFRQLVGTDPGTLAPAPPLPALPVDDGEAENQAVARDPRMTEARATAQAADAAIRTARAAGRPTVTLTGGGEYHNYSQSPVAYPDQRGFGGEASVAVAYPIYQGGLVRAQIAQARAIAAKAGFERDATMRATSADVRTALARYTVSLRAIAELEHAVLSERDALTGTHIEAKAGERSVLDELNADLELLDVETQLVSARHDLYLAGVAVMRSLDRLSFFAQASDARADGPGI